MLKQRGVEFVDRLNKANRRADFQRGTRLGKDDHLVCWTKPTSIRSVDRQTYHLLPDSFTVREARFRVEQPGFRTRFIVVVTTLLDPEPNLADRERVGEWEVCVPIQGTELVRGQPVGPSSENEWRRSPGIGHRASVWVRSTPPLLRTSQTEESTG
jgi:hypothetical protein